MSLFADAARMEKQNIPFAMVIITESRGSAPRHDGQMLVMPEGNILGTVGGGMMERKVIDEALVALQDGKSRLFHGRMTRNGQDAVGSDCGGAMSVFISVHGVRPRLLLVGGGHVNRAIAHAASALNFNLLVTDIYAPNLQAGDFPAGTSLLLSHSFADALKEIVPDENTYVVIATNSSDLEVVSLLMEYPCRYLGLLASRRKVHTFTQHFMASGLTSSQLAHLRAPIGFDIGAETPEEIAISVLAEILQVKNGASGMLLDCTSDCLSVTGETA